MLREIPPARRNRLREKVTQVVSLFEFLSRSHLVAQFLPQRKEPGGSWGLAELEESLAVTSKSRRLGERLKATTGKSEKLFCSG